MNKELKKIIYSDLSRITPKCNFGSYLKWTLFPKGSTFPYQVSFRKLQYYKKKKMLKYSIGLLEYFKYRKLTYKYGIHANANIPVGKELSIVHGASVFINCDKIGDHFTIYPMVMLGEAGNHSGIEGKPTIGNNVTIYTGSIIVGNVVLNDNCVVAANSFVNHDVPANTIVAGSPAKIIGCVDTNSG